MLKTSSGSMLIKNITINSRQTQKLGEKLAKEILELPLQKSAVILGLQGNLGGGKTTFLQGFAKGLGIKEKILSPTYAIMKKFKIPKIPLHTKCPTAHFIYNERFCNFYHFDCYRLNGGKDFLELDFKKIVTDSKNIVAIEWPEKIKSVLPKNTIKIRFKVVGENKRNITT